MASATRLQREHELVALLLFDKPALIATYRQAMQLPTDASLFGVLDRDMIRAILDAEYPAARRMATSTSWSTTDEHRYWTA